MVTKLLAKKRANESPARLRLDGRLPIVLYGVKRENISLSVDEKDFYKLYEEAGESTLISLEIEGMKEKLSVLIYDTQRDPLKGNIIHADLYEPDLKEKVEAEIPLVFVGESPAVKDMEGTLVKNADSLNVSALPQELPHEIEVNIEALKTFDDVICVKDLQVPSGVEIMQDPEWTVVLVSAPTNVEEELEKPIEEGEEETEIIGEEKEKEEEEESEEEKTEEKQEK